MKIPVTRPYFDRKEERILVETLRSGWVAQGPRVAELEQAICDFTGVKYVVATTSGTTALFLALRLLDIGPGDEVIVPSFSFIATANVVVHVGAKPVFVDIDPRTYNIDPIKIKEAITGWTKAIIPVDQVGLPYDHDEVAVIAGKNGLHIIEDAACALGSVYKGKMIGSFGEICALSFHPRKAITTGEGGVILTNNKVWADKLRILRHHGMSISDVARHMSKRVVKESYSVIGYNFRMSDLQAAVGVTQMVKLKKILKKRTYLASRYSKAFEKSSNVISPYVPAGYTHNWQSYIVRLSKRARITRDRLMQELLDSGIATRIGVMAAHEEPVYKKLLGKISLPETEAATRETVTLPIFYHMTNRQQDFVIKKLLTLAGG